MHVCVSCGQRYLENSPVRKDNCYRPYCNGEVKPITEEVVFSGPFIARLFRDIGAVRHYLVTRDQANAAIHMSEVRWSAVTNAAFRVDNLLKGHLSEPI